MILSSVSAVNDFNPNLSCINSKLCYEINTFRLIVNIFIKKIYKLSKFFFFISDFYEIENLQTSRSLKGIIQL